MSMGDMMSQVDPNILSPLVFEHERAQKCMMPMGLTSEEVAEKFGVTREKQDQLAVDSHAKAVQAMKDGVL